MATTQNTIGDQEFAEKLDEVYDLITNIAKVNPAQLGVVRVFAARVQTILDGNLAGESSTPTVDNGDKNPDVVSKSTSGDKPPPPPTVKPASRPIKPLTTMKLRQTTKSANAVRLPSVSSQASVSTIPSASSSRPSSAATSITTNSTPEANLNQASQQPLKPLKASGPTAQPNLTNGNGPSKVVAKLPSDIKFSRPVRKLSPTREEWENFGEFFAAIQATDAEGLGVVLINLPNPIRDAVLVKGVKEFSITGTRVKTTYSRKGWMNIQGIREGAEAFRFRLQTTVDCSEIMPQTTVEKLIESFEQMEGVRESPIYAAEKDVDSALHRDYYHLPPVSAIFPLRGNALDNTKVALAGVHTPWTYVSEDFGTCFSLHTEDFNLASLNVVLAGASKVWTVISPLDIPKLEAFLSQGRQFKTGCSQWIRHADIYIPATKLEELGIRYTQFEQRKGQVVITLPGAYHQGFNAGFNVAEAVNFADEITLSKQAEYKSCSTKVCGNTAPTSESMEPLLGNATQTLIGITEPSEIERVRQPRGQKRKRPTAGPTAISYSSSARKEQFDGATGVQRQENTPANTNSEGSPIIPIMRVYSTLVAQHVQIEKKSQVVTSYYAAIISSIVMEWGSPEAFQQLSETLVALSNKPLPPKTRNSPSNENRMQNVVDQIRSLDYFEANQHISSIATRYHMSLLAERFDSVAGSSQKEISAAWLELVTKLHPSLPQQSDAFKRQKEKLRHRVTYGRRWQKLVSQFGISIIVLLPQDVPLGVCNTLVHSLPNSIFDLLLETMKTEQGRWIQDIGLDVGQYMISRLNDDFGGTEHVKLPLEIINSSLLSQMKYRSKDLLDLCVLPGANR